MKKILIFSTTYFPFVGGAEIAVKEITNRIKDIQFDMITLRFDSKLPKFEKIGNINVYRISFAKKSPTMPDLLKFPLKLNKFLFPLLAYCKACSLNKKNKYDATWSIMAAFAGFAGMFFKYTHKKIPFLLTLQEGDPISEIKSKVKFVKSLFKKIFLSANIIQAISVYLGDWAKNMGFDGQIEIIPNAVDTKKFSKEYSQNELNELKLKLNKKENDIFLITTSRLVKKNAIDDVIKSLKYLNTNVKFIILGTGPDLISLKDLVELEDVSNRVMFVGQTEHDEIPKYLRISDIFIRPSLSEGFGNSFIEAMASGMPIIATQVGGIKDFIFSPQKNSNKKPTGIFVNITDPRDIAEKIQFLLDNKEVRDEIIKNAKELVFEKYDWNLIAKNMKERVFDKLLAG
ncbi:MAG: glycosyltransferase family 4 protein [Candidatus Paceibacterota bacterium]